MPAMKWPRARRLGMREKTSSAKRMPATIKTPMLMSGRGTAGVSGRDSIISQEMATAANTMAKSGGLDSAYAKPATDNKTSV